MNAINLLPWREELKKIKNRIFYASLSIFIAGSSLLIIILHVILSTWVMREKANIEYLSKEESVLRKKVQEIQGLQDNKKQLLHQMNVIESVQEKRSQVVQLLDLLAHKVPEGITLTSISRKIEKIFIKGMSETNAHISNFLKNLEGSKGFSDVKLLEVTTDKKAYKLIFKLEFTQLNQSELE